MNSISYCAECGREIRINSHAYSETVVGLLCVNCREEETTEPNNLSEHPRCECGASGVKHPLMVFKDHAIYRVCEHKRVGFYHNGKKVEHCLFCAGNGDPCHYCNGIWS